MHKVQPNQQVMIVAVEIAVPADVTEGDLADEISALLSESGTANPNSNILDWRYLTEERFIIASADPEEGEVFGEPNPLVKINQELLAALRPFARVADYWDMLAERGENFSMNEIAPLTLEPYQAARSAIARAKGETNDG